MGARCFRECRGGWLSRKRRTLWETVVADESPDGTNPFDVQIIKQLVALMSRYDLSEIDLRRGESRICLRRGAAVAAAPPASLPTMMPMPVPVAASHSAVSATESPARTETPGRSLHVIK